MNPNPGPNPILNPNPNPGPKPKPKPNPSPNPNPDPNLNPNPDPNPYPDPSQVGLPARLRLGRARQPHAAHRADLLGTTQARPLHVPPPAAPDTERHLRLALPGVRHKGGGHRRGLRPPQRPGNPNPTPYSLHPTPEPEPPNPNPNPNPNSDPNPDPPNPNPDPNPNPNPTRAASLASSTRPSTCARSTARCSAALSPRCSGAFSSTGRPPPPSSTSCPVWGRASASMPRRPCSSRRGHTYYGHTYFDHTLL